MIIINAAIIVPLLKGRPIVFTKKTSDSPKNARVEGSKSLKITSRIAVAIRFA